MPGPKCLAEVAAAADLMVKKPYLPAKEAMRLAGFTAEQCETRKLQKRVNQKKLRELKAKKLPLEPKESRCRMKANTVQKNISLYYGYCRRPLIYEPMLIFPSGSPRVALAACYLIINPYLSVENAMISAGFVNKDCICRSKQRNVSMKKKRLIKAFSRLEDHIPSLSFENPLPGYDTKVRCMLFLILLYHDSESFLLKSSSPYLCLWY
jgi:hypothetical protein